MNPDAEALHAQAQALLHRQQKALQTINEELAYSQNKLREMSKLRDNIYARLFPPMGPGKDSKDILAQIERHTADSKDIQQAIVDQEAEIRVLEAETLTSETASRLSRGRDNLSDLRRKLLVASSSVESMRKSLSPIRVLPPEVLGYIFSYADETRFSPNDPTPDALVITHVCSSWRLVAISTPSLWSNIRVTIHDESEGKEWLSLLKVWLDRSKAHPLMFKIRESDKLDFNSTPGSDFFRILNLFIPHIRRWRSVSLTNTRFSAPGWHWFGDVPDDVSCPLLESLSVKCYSLEPGDISKIEKMADRSPRLRHLTWRYNSDPSFPNFPWAQLTHLELVTLVDLDQVLNILSNGIHLVSVDLTIQAHPLMAHSTLPHVVHPNLKTLAIGISGDLSVLLDFLTLPNLTELSIDILPSMVIMVTMGGSNASWQQTNFVGFLTRSQCKLKELSFLDANVEPQDLITMLRYLSPYLNSITMENVTSPCITDEVLKALTYPSTTSTLGELATQGTSGDESSVLCPHLKCIRFLGCLDSTDGVLADMVQSRLHKSEGSTNLATLVSASFAMHPDRSQSQDAERLAAMRRESARNVIYLTLEPHEY